MPAGATRPFGARIVPASRRCRQPLDARSSRTGCALIAGIGGTPRVRQTEGIGNAAKPDRWARLVGYAHPRADIRFLRTDTSALEGRIGECAAAIAMASSSPSIR